MESVSHNHPGSVDTHASFAFENLVRNQALPDGLIEELTGTSQDVAEDIEIWSSRDLWEPIGTTCSPTGEPTRRIDPRWTGS